MTSGKAMDCTKVNLKRNYWQEAVKLEYSGLFLQSQQVQADIASSKLTLR